VLIGLGLVAFTWYLHFFINVLNSIYIALLFSLTALKGLTLLFDYSRFQKMFARMLRKDRSREIVLIEIGVAAGPESPGYKDAVLGQRMGLISLEVIIVFITVAAIFFTLAFWGR